MHLLRIPSVIRRVLMQRLESKEAKNEIVSDGEYVEVMNSEQEAVHAIREHDMHLAVENARSVSTSEDMVDGDFSRLLPLSFVHKGDVFGDEEPSSYFFDCMSHFGEQSATFFSDLFHEAAPIDPYDCFVEQVLSRLAADFLLSPVAEAEADVDIKSQLSSSSDFNHYHQYVDQSSFEDGCQFSDISPVSGHEYFAEVQQDAEVTQANDNSFSHNFGTVEGFLGGERLETGDDDLINFYDGEPIEIGVPVVLDPIDSSSGNVLENEGPGLRNVPGGHLNDQRNSIHVSLSGNDDIAVDSIDCGWGDISFTFHADKSWAGNVVTFERFELGGDSLRIESVLEMETMESLLDNRPMESVGADGEQALCFSIVADSGAECTISFLGMSLDEYMDFLSSSVKDLTVV